MQQYSELLRSLLEKRGILDEEQAQIFLNPSYERDFLDPYLMRDMQKACLRIFTAIEKKERIVIYADYDCDGIPGAVILSDFFNKIGYENFEVYIPQRNGEGYGLNIEAIDQFAESETKLIITVDLGITAVREVEYAKEKGIEVIITDHHIPPTELPAAYAILNPKIDEYPEKMLCGAGVAFKLVQGLVAFMKQATAVDGALKISPPLGKKFYKAETAGASSVSSAIAISQGWEKWLLDMAGLATLSDMVPLLGENRAIAYFGMKVLRKSPRPGLQKLLQKIKIDQRYLSPDDVGYMITPKLNAASRMDNPRRAFELLSTSDMAEAGALADHLAKINDERKTIVTSIMREVNKNFEMKKTSEEIREVIVVGNPKWRVGVLGLVASRISEEYERPVFVWGADEKDCIRGSCRSDGSASVVDLMTESRSSFLEFGGHELAGGFSVARDQVHFLEENLSQAFMKVKREKLAGGVAYDLKMNLGDVNMKNWKDIEKMEPFGFNNPKPVFFFEGVKIENIKKFGKNGGEHLEIIFSDPNGQRAVAISFFSSEDSFQAPILPGAHVNLLGTFDLSRFRGRAELRLRIVDIL